MPTTTTTDSPNPSATRQRNKLARGFGLPPQKRVKRTPFFTKDSDGAAIVYIRTPRAGMTAKLLAEDFTRLMAQGFSDQWCINTDGKGRHPSVCLSVTGLKGTLLTVSRLVADAGRGVRVTFKDGNRLNLRRDNLILNEGFAKGRERGVVELKAWTNPQAGQAV